MIGLVVALEGTGQVSELYNRYVAWDYTVCTQHFLDVSAPQYAAERYRNALGD